MGRALNTELYNYSTVSQELKECWGNFLSGLAEWQWFVTMTFRERVGLWAAQRLWARFWTEEQRVLGRLDWVRCSEYQHWRGVPHYHALVTGMSDYYWHSAQCRILAKEMANDIAGFTRILEYDPALGASYYLAKYTIKNLVDIQFTRGLTKPSNSSIVGGGNG